MTCCVDDIQYGGVVAQWENAEGVRTGQWMRVVGKLRFEYNDLYGEKGPVLKILNVVSAPPPEEKVVTFY